MRNRMSGLVIFLCSLLLIVGDIPRGWKALLEQSLDVLWIMPVLLFALYGVRIGLPLLLKGLVPGWDREDDTSRRGPTHRPRAPLD